MAGRFSTRRATPDFPAAEPASLPPSAPDAPPPALPAASAPLPEAADGVAWTVFPEATPEPDPIVPLMLATPAEPVAAPARPGANPLLTDKLLDAKVRLHRKLIEEINLSALEKLPEDEIRKHVQQLVSQYILVEDLALKPPGH